MKPQKLLNIEQVFRDADCQHLIKMGAPSDEYDHEAKEIFDNIDWFCTVLYIQIELWGIFYKGFCTGTKFNRKGKEIFWSQSYDKAIKGIGTVADYLEMAKKIKNIIAAH